MNISNLETDFPFINNSVSCCPEIFSITVVPAKPNVGSVTKFLFSKFFFH